MATIDPRLIELLKKRMGAARRTVYAAIQKTAAANRVTRDLGALLLAGEYGISYQRYATPEQMTELRGATIHVMAGPIPPQDRGGGPRPAKKPVVTINNNYSAASRKELAQRLKTKLKFKVDTTGSDWLTIGDFDR